MDFFLRYQNGERRCSLAVQLLDRWSRFLLNFRRQKSAYARFIAYGDSQRPCFLFSSYLPSVAHLMYSFLSEIYKLMAGYLIFCCGLRPCWHCCFSSMCWTSWLIRNTRHLKIYKRSWIARNLRFANGVLARSKPLLSYDILCPLLSALQILNVNCIEPIFSFVSGLGSVGHNFGPFAAALPDSVRNVKPELPRL